MRDQNEAIRLEDLLAHAEGLRRLAQRLVGGADAEDLVQETWAAALHHPPVAQGDNGPWLRQVLLNFARRRWRAARVREAAKPLVAETHEPPTPEDVLERAEAQRLLATLVIELEEPYRTVVWLRFYEGRTSPEIARALGVPAGTVRWRLAEGLRRLRERLQARENGKVWRALVGAFGGTGAAGVRLIPAAAVGAVLLAASLVIVSARPERSVPPSIAAPAAERVPRLQGHPATAKHSIEGLVLGPDARPVAGAQVTLASISTAIHNASGRVPEASATTDSEGRFAFKPARAGRHSVAASAAGFTAAVSPPFEASATNDLILRLGTGGATLAGQVVDESGKPIPQALVTARLGKPWDRVAPAFHQARADDQGRFELGLAPRQYVVLVQATGFVSSAANVGVRGRVWQEWRLTRSGRIMGRVLQRGSRAAVAGARVRLSPLYRTTIEGEARATAADADGRFVFADVEPGRYQLHGKAEGFVGAGPHVTMVSTEEVTGLEVTLDRGAAVAGKVTAADGTPIASARVSFPFTPDTPVGDIDPTGSFRLESVPPGHHLLRAEISGGAARSGSRKVKVGWEGVVMTSLVVEPTATITGRVLTHEARPAPGVLVQMNAERPGSSISVASQEIVTDEHGSFVIQHAGALGPDPLVVHAWHPGLGTATGEIPSPPAGGAEHIELRLSAGATAAGTVFYDDGRPAAGVTVNLKRLYGLSLYESATTDDRGAFEVSHLRPGVYEFTAMKRLNEAYGSRNESTLGFELREGARGEVVVHLAGGGGVIRGLARLHDGTPARGAIVYAGLEQPRRLFRPARFTGEARAIADAEGRFVFSDLEAGTYTLWGLRVGLPDEIVHGVRTSSEVALTFGQAATVSGHVFTSDGRPLQRYEVVAMPGVAVTRFDRIEQQDPLRGCVSVLNPDGAFELTGVTPGDRELRVRTDEGLGARLRLTLTPGEHRRNVRVTVDAGTTVIGRIVDARGRPLPSLRTYVGLRDLYDAPLARHLETTTDGEGRFHFDHVTMQPDLELRATDAHGRTTAVRDIPQRRDPVINLGDIGVQR